MHFFGLRWNITLNHYKRNDRSTWWLLFYWMKFIYKLYTSSYGCYTLFLSVFSYDLCSQWGLVFETAIYFKDICKWYRGKQVSQSLKYCDIFLNALLLFPFHTFVCYCSFSFICLFNWKGLHDLFCPCNSCGAGSYLPCLDKVGYHVQL